MHWDDTCRKLRDWSDGSAQAEGLARQVIQNQGYSNVDPIHPRGGPDGKKDAICTRDGENWILAVYFPRRSAAFSSIKKKFSEDLAGVAANSAVGIVFVTNQEISETERKRLKTLAGKTRVDLFHLDRVATVLDQPGMRGVRSQFLGATDETSTMIAFGGEGGRAPGAGGGGGAAIGPGARAGDGGPGGRMTKYTKEDFDALTKTVIEIATPTPGAGGPGASTGADSFQAGHGGGGGDFVVGRLTTKMLDRIGVVRVNVRVGAGGTTKDGQPSGFDFIDDRGFILISINSPGGRSGDSHLRSTGGGPAAPIQIETSETRLLCAALVSAGEIQGGLAYLLGAGWTIYRCEAIPSKVTWPLFLQVALGGLQPGGNLDLSCVVLDPSGNEVHTVPLSLGRDSTDSNPVWTGFVPIPVTISQTGIWSVVLRTKDRELNRLRLDVVLVPSQSAPKPVENNGKPAGS